MCLRTDPTSKRNVSRHLSTVTANYSTCQQQEVYVTMEIRLHRQKTISIKQEGKEDDGLLVNDIV
jgi:hypothetical protein